MTDEPCPHHDGAPRRSTCDGCYRQLADELNELRARYDRSLHGRIDWERDVAAGAAARARQEADQVMRHAAYTRKNLDQILEPARAVAGRASMIEPAMAQPKHRDQVRRFHEAAARDLAEYEAAAESAAQDARELWEAWTAENRQLRGLITAAGQNLHHAQAPGRREGTEPCRCDGCTLIRVARLIPCTPAPDGLPDITSPGWAGHVTVTFTGPSERAGGGARVHDRPLEDWWPAGGTGVRVHGPGTGADGHYAGWLYPDPGTGRWNADLWDETRPMPANPGGRAAVRWRDIPSLQDAEDQVRELLETAGPWWDRSPAPELPPVRRITPPAGPATPAADAIAAVLAEPPRRCRLCGTSIRHTPNEITGEWDWTDESGSTCGTAPDLADLYDPDRNPLGAASPYDALSKLSARITDGKAGLAPGREYASLKIRIGDGPLHHVHQPDSPGERPAITVPEHCGSPARLRPSGWHCRRCGTLIHDEDLAVTITPAPPCDETAAPPGSERDETPRCAVCGRPVTRAPTGRPRAYCSRACQARAYRARAATGTDTDDQALVPASGEHGDVHGGGHAAGLASPGCAEVLHADDQDDVMQVVLLVPQEHRPFAEGLEPGCRLIVVERHADPAHRDRVGDPLGDGLHLGDLIRRQAPDDVGSIRRVLPRPVAHAAASSATRRISPSSAETARAASRSAAAAARPSHSRSWLASAGHRRTATHIHQRSTKCRTGIRSYASRAAAVAAVHSSSNRDRAAASSRATADRIADGVRSGIGITGSPAGMLTIEASYGSSPRPARLPRRQVPRPLRAPATTIRVPDRIPCCNQCGFHLMKLWKVRHPPPRASDSRCWHVPRRTGCPGSVKAARRFTCTPHDLDLLAFLELARQLGDRALYVRRETVGTDPETGEPDDGLPAELARRKGQICDLAVAFASAHGILHTWSATAPWWQEHLDREDAALADAGEEGIQAEQEQRRRAERELADAILADGEFRASSPGARRRRGQLLIPDGTDRHVGFMAADLARQDAEALPEEAYRSVREQLAGLAAEFLASPGWQQAASAAARKQAAEEFLAARADGWHF